MPSTVSTTEVFAAGTPEASVAEERRLRLKAGAITSSYEGDAVSGWTLTTVWNVLGE